MYIPLQSSVEVFFFFVVKCLVKAEFILQKVNLEILWNDERLRVRQSATQSCVVTSIHTADSDYVEYLLLASSTSYHIAT